MSPRYIKYDFGCKAEGDEERASPDFHNSLNQAFFEALMHVDLRDPWGQKFSSVNLRLYGAN